MIDNLIIIWAPDDYNALALMRQVGQKFNNIFFLIHGNVGYAAKSKYFKFFALLVASRQEHYNHQEPK